MHVVVLGGTGFIGGRVVPMLAQRGHAVTVFHRGGREAAPVEGVRHVHGSFADLRTHVGELAPDGADVVLDMVPYIDKGGHGIRLFRGVAGRAVAITSGDVYRAFARLWRSEPGLPDAVPLDEDAPRRVQRAPDLSLDDGIDYDNLEVETAFAADDVPTPTVLRLAATYGPGDPQRRLARYVSRMLAGDEAIVVDERRAGWRFSRAYVENVAAAIALAVESEAASGREFNVAEPRAYTESEWIHRLGAVCGWQGEVVAVPSDYLPARLVAAHDYAQDLVLDSGRIRRELGYLEAVDEAEALRRSVDWERGRPRPEAEADRAAEAEALRRFRRARRP